MELMVGDLVRLRSSMWLLIVKRIVDPETIEVEFFASTHYEKIKDVIRYCACSQHHPNHILSCPKCIKSHSLPCFTERTGE